MIVSLVGVRSLTLNADPGLYRLSRAEIAIKKTVV